MLPNHGLHHSLPADLLETSVQSAVLLFKVVPLLDANSWEEAEHFVSMCVIGFKEFPVDQVV